MVMIDEQAAYPCDSLLLNLKMAGRASAPEEGRNGSCEHPYAQMPFTAAIGIS